MTMTLRRIGVTIALLLGVTVAVTPPASADSGVVVRGQAGFGAAGMRYISQSCSDPGVAGGPFSAFAQFDTSGYGDHALGWQTTTGSEIGGLARVGDPLRLSALRARIKGQVTGQVVALYDDTNANFSNGYWVGRSDLLSFNSPGGWTAYDQPYRAMTWTFYEANGTEGNTYQNQVTVAQFAALFGTNGSGAYVGYALGCNGARFVVDGLAAGGAGTTTTYDLEAPAPTTRLLWTFDNANVYQGNAAVRYGSPIKMLGDSYDASGFATGPGTLYAKPWGSSSFVKVANGSFDTQRYAESVQQPGRQTTYRFVSAATNADAAATSSDVTVFVEPKLNARVDRSVRQGQRVGVTGSLNPGTRGTRVILQRQTGKRWRTIATSRTNRRGHFSVGARAGSAGRWKIRLVVAPSSGNLGTSTVTVKVKVAKRVVRRKATSSSQNHGQSQSSSGQAQSASSSLPSVPAGGGQHHGRATVAQTKVRPSTVPDQAAPRPAAPFRQ